MVATQNLLFSLQIVYGLKLSICKLTNAISQFEKLIFAHFKMVRPDMHMFQHNQFLYSPRPELVE